MNIKDKLVLAAGRSRGRGDILRKMVLIRSKELQMHYTFTKDECHKELTGICSLELLNKNESKLIAKKRAKINYCKDIYNYLKNSEDFNDIDPIELVKYSCNHYEINCGRHRICICQKKDLLILVDISNEDDKCDECLSII